MALGTKDIYLIFKQYWIVEIVTTATLYIKKLSLRKSINVLKVTQGGHVSFSKVIF